MTDNPISNDLRQFMTDCIQSVEHLEILCLLADDPSRDWSVADAFRQIQSTEKSVREALQHFTTCKLFVANKDGTFRFAAGSAQLNASAMSLIKTYRERRVAVIEAIYKRPKESVQHFAEAFRLRKEK